VTVALVAPAARPCKKPGRASRAPAARPARQYAGRADAQGSTRTNGSTACPSWGARRDHLRNRSTRRSRPAAGEIKRHSQGPVQDPVPRADPRPGQRRHRRGLVARRQQGARRGRRAGGERNKEYGDYVGGGRDGGPMRCAATCPTTLWGHDRTLAARGGGRPCCPRGATASWARSYVGAERPARASSSGSRRTWDVEPSSRCFLARQAPSRSTGYVGQLGPLPEIIGQPRQGDRRGQAHAGHPVPPPGGQQCARGCGALPPGRAGQQQAFLRAHRQAAGEFGPGGAAESDQLVANSEMGQVSLDPPGGPACFLALVIGLILQQREGETPLPPVAQGAAAAGAPRRDLQDSGQSLRRALSAGLARDVQRPRFEALHPPAAHPAPSEMGEQGT